jgi:hypothetical protein
MFLGSVTATSECTGSLIKCLCPSGVYEYHSPDAAEFQEALQNPKSCCYREKDSIIPSPIIINPSASGWGSVHTRPERPLQISIPQINATEDSEVFEVPTIIKIEAYEVPEVSTKSWFETLLQQFLPNQSQISIYLTSLSPDQR